LAYNLPSTTAGSGQTVAIVDAYDDPNAEADMNTYRTQFGIPTCTSNTGCFRKVSQSGTTKYPFANGGWSQEISLDLDMVSAICPSCHILLVEANGPTTLSLGAAVNTAVKLGATEVSNSYGGRETFLDNWYDNTYFNHPGVAITASTGDGGYGVEYPAASRFVTGVGGTRLTRDSSARGWTESVWSTSAKEGAGSGCSTKDARPTWQSAVPAITTVCGQRAVADVSAVADPATGVAVFDSFAYKGASGWLKFGGTSVSSPIVASIYALAGNAKSVTYGSYPYGHTSALNDVTTGQTAACGSVLCAAAVGWDGPTGLGTPNGTGAF
jgi:subtilase family serine protease